MGARGVQQAVAAMAAAYAPDIQPPSSVVLRDADRPIWAAVMDCRARGEWSDIDLFHAANLVRCLADIEVLCEEIRTEGHVIEGEEGGKSTNLKHALLEKLSNRAIALTRLLHLQANVLVKDTAKLLPQRAAEQEARRMRDEIARDPMLPPGADGAELDSLLARPGAYQ